MSYRRNQRRAGAGSGMFWPLALILVGIVLLLSNLGIVPGNAWDMLWPLLLIALGVWVLWGALARPRAHLEAEPASVPLGDATQARLHIRHGAGRLIVHGGAPAELLVDGSFTGGVDAQVRRDGTLIDATLQPADGVAATMFTSANWGRNGGLQWTLALNQTVALELEVESGASETRMDLTDLCVSDLRLKTGASSTEVTLPAAAHFTRVRIGSGAASVRVRVPGGVAARIHVDSGLAEVNVDTTRFPKRGEYYESPDYISAANKVEMNVETGVGSVTVQ